MKRKYKDDFYSKYLEYLLLDIRNLNQLNLQMKRKYKDDFYLNYSNNLLLESRNSDADRSVTRNLIYNNNKYNNKKNLRLISN